MIGNGDHLIDLLEHVAFYPGEFYGTWATPSRNLLSHLQIFFRRFLTVSRIFLIMTLFRGLIYKVWVMIYTPWSQNIPNSQQLYWGSISAIRISRIPLSLKTDFWHIRSVVVEAGSFLIVGNLQLLLQLLQITFTLKNIWCQLLLRRSLE